ncbi:MAG: YbjQ family protein [Candidatus Nanoarchaeia archaeon]
MILTTTDYITGKKTEILGMVRGSTVQTKHIGRDIMASLKTIVGGEIKGYTSMINQARDVAINRMIKEAEEKKADAIINVRFVTAEIMPGAAEVMAYGTAVKLK